MIIINELLGWLGLLLLLATLLVCLMRRTGPGGNWRAALLRYHKNLALAALTVLTLHGLLALSGGNGFGHGYGRGGGGAHFLSFITSGILSWALLLTICLLALNIARKKSYFRGHCWLVIPLIFITMLYHL